MTDKQDPQAAAQAAAVAPTPAAVAQSGAPAPLVAAPVHWTDKYRAKLNKDTWLRERYDSLFLPVASPTSFTESEAQLVKKLTPKTSDNKVDDERAQEVLDEAQAHYDAVEDRISGAHTRATTLQGAVAVATSLIIAGGALLADPSKVQGDGWRLWLALALIGTVFSLVMTGVRALAATSRIHVFHHPTPTNIFTRVTKPVGVARIELAAELLKTYSFNTKVADWKVAYLRAAAWWFRWALGFLVALALALGSYAVFGPEAKKADEPASTVTKTTP